MDRYRTISSDVPGNQQGLHIVHWGSPVPPLHSQICVAVCRDPLPALCEQEVLEVNQVGKARQDASPAVLGSVGSVIHRIEEISTAGKPLAIGA